MTWLQVHHHGICACATASLAYPSALRGRALILLNTCPISDTRCEANRPSQRPIEQEDPTGRLPRARLTGINAKIHMDKTSMHMHTTYTASHSLPDCNLDRHNDDDMDNERTLPLRNARTESMSWDTVRMLLPRPRGRAADGNGAARGDGDGSGGTAERGDGDGNGDGDGDARADSSGDGCGDSRGDGDV
jgi:hypothetical protein